MRYEFGQALVLGVVGLSVGFVIAYISGGMCAAGHGWCSSTLSAVSVFLAPLAGCAWSMRKHAWSLWLSLFVVAAAVVLDIAIVWQSMEEGLYYAAKIWNHVPGTVIFWAALLASWQLLAIFAAITTYKIRAKLDSQPTD
jgi:hypothetical protein